MKFATYKEDYRIGVILDDKIFDLKKVYTQYLHQIKRLPYTVSEKKANQIIPSDTTDFISLGKEGLKIVSTVLNYLKDEYSVEFMNTMKNSKLGTPIPNPPKDIICLARNYPAYVKSGGIETPKFPLLFMKARSSIIGPDDNVLFHELATDINHEVELAVIIGEGGKDISIDEAMKHVLGYTIIDEITASNIVKMYQRRGQCLGKSFYTFAPMGTFLVTKDEVDDPHNLKINLTVDGENISERNTHDMIFNIPETISFISKVLMLEPGDIIATGTPFAVGPLEYGQTCEASIEKIGVLKYYVGP